MPSVVLSRSEVREDAVSGLVLRCGGEIDSLNAHDLTTTVVDGLAHVIAMTPTPPAEHQLLVLDLREVTFFGASAVSALLAAIGETPSGHVALRLVVGHTRPVLLVVDALELRDTFSIHDDLPAALRGPAP